ncbi:hypothetical protein A2875_02515 [Candidatus Gottesmanbacteria bacterium RIFCSPHIGHO2_01_FULL_46_14]|uniref:Glycosyltransferase 2-like domain-containing protein n=3 Tax=Microgenomates group TaxID=1794810 RepID=A0A1F5ZN33_9BACT|nr:MAG: Glycosyl transferase family 2 [Candidatus Curtissbacteria bacterium GW2011_GWA1_41_11]OGG13773.1 MAG: hypothetical protein A2875_02515 [Candidatus Gottesmanbacteria bacterium RIFCSPHIGHO2_01_FULL_46_14]OGG28623.1 MAG: hypothetical protein A2971_04790 [Candidatus Gottesmanbacteria bacterium RIFCSPLOWO2_01_FULL_46_21]
MKKVSIIIPVYNEARTIDLIIPKVLAAHISGWTKEVIVIDDGSTDGTADKLGRWKRQCRIFFERPNRGKGAAVTVGLKHATGDVILIQDADLEYDPADYPKLLSPFDNAHVNVVYGSRFLGPHLSTMLVYELGNKFVTLMTNILFNTNITDMETGYKAFRRSVLGGLLPLRAKRFDLEPELSAKFLKLGLQIYEVPISYFGRKFSEGKKLTWRDGVIALWTLLWLRFF